ncbi:peptide chain release factor H [Orbaceae bacterium ESL0727]|nr:peptide chain release factor H [Orbaceae bacterium ESL0727]
MALLHFSAAKGPDECALAVAKALACFLQEANRADVTVEILESDPGDKPGTLRSVLVSVDGPQADALISRWQGSIQWVCQSPYRPKHKRKNWFIGVNSLPQPPHFGESEIRFETTKSSGAGGQHVNKTESAVRATHLQTGISVKVQSERSQHANKRLATLLLSHKLAELNNHYQQQHKIIKHQRHQQIARGDAHLLFYGETFVEKLR